MKICLVSPYDWIVPGGVNSHSARLREQFVARGHDVRIVAPASKRVNEPDVVIIGKRPVSLPVSGSLARISLSLTLGAPVRKLLAAEQFDIVHVHEPFMPVLPILFLRYSDAVNIGTFHATRKTNQFFYTWGKRHLRRWIRRLDGKIAVSTAAAGYIEQYFPGYYNIIPNGVDVEHFSKPTQPFEEFQDGKLNILFVGRPEQRKGLDYMLEAFSQVKAQRGDTRLIVVGAGKFDRYERIVKSMRLRDVIFRGYAAYDDLPRYHQTSHVYCAPNTGFESQGIVLLEAMAAGLPVVASNIEGFAAVVTHGVEGLLALPADASGLASALLELLDDPERRARMAERGRARAQDYGWPRISQRILSYYERLLHERAIAGAQSEPQVS